MFCFFLPFFILFVFSRSDIEDDGFEKPCWGVYLATSSIFSNARALTPDKTAKADSRITRLLRAFTFLIFFSNRLRHLDVQYTRIDHILCMYRVLRSLSRHGDLALRPGREAGGEMRRARHVCGLGGRLAQLDFFFLLCLRLDFYIIIACHPHHPPCHMFTSLYSDKKKQLLKTKFLVWAIYMHAMYIDINAISLCLALKYSL